MLTEPPQAVYVHDTGYLTSTADGRLSLASPPTDVCRFLQLRSHLLAGS